MIPESLLNTSYLNLATFRQSGVQVNTPVWFGQDGKNLYILSAGNAGKVKRLGNSAKAKVASCTYSGTLTGNWYDASAVLLSNPSEVGYAHSQLKKKYGWQMRAFNFFSFIGGRINKRIYIRVTLDPVKDAIKTSS